VPNRSPTPTSKTNDFLGQSDDIWGPISGRFGGVLGVRASSNKIIYLLALRNCPHVYGCVSTYRPSAHAKPGMLGWAPSGPPRDGPHGAPQRDNRGLGLLWGVIETHRVPKLSKTHTTLNPKHSKPYVGWFWVGFGVFWWVWRCFGTPWGSITLKLVSRALFWVHSAPFFLCRTRRDGSRDPIWPESDRKLTNFKTLWFMRASFPKQS
jgi:hypothetical protein